MTAEQLLNWALENIYSSDWRLPMTIKVNEDKIKKLTTEQVEAIDLLISLIKRNKWYSGGVKVIRLSEIEDIQKLIKSIVYKK